MIYGTTGKPVTVAEAFSVQVGRDCFRVTFLDGTSVIASDGHLWKAKPSGWPKQYNRVWATRQMYEHKAKRRAIPIPGPQQRPERDLPMDPYLLGYWLGDGSTAGCNITVGDEDLEAFTANMTEIGVTVRPVGTKKGAANRMTFSDKTGFGANMGGEQARALRLLPCYRDKHIPEEYLLASIDPRIALLQGLLARTAAQPSPASSLSVGSGCPAMYFSSCRYWVSGRPSPSELTHGPGTAGRGGYRLIRGTSPNASGWPGSRQRSSGPHVLKHTLLPLSRSSPCRCAASASMPKTHCSRPANPAS